MQTLLKPPAGFGTKDPSGAFMLADGHIMRRDARGYYDFAGHEHLIAHYKIQGWTEPPAAPKQWADEFEREAAERPMDVSAIIRLAEAEQVAFRVDRGKLYFRPVAFASRRLVAHLKAQRDKVIAELERRANVKWEEV